MVQRGGGHLSIRNQKVPKAMVSFVINFITCELLRFILRWALRSSELLLSITFSSRFPFASLKQFLKSILHVNHDALFMFANTTSIEKVMTIQSSELLMEGFSKTLSTFDEL